MYERFTDRARKVMQLANEQVRRFNHEYIDTEHVLLGLVKEGGGVAADVLKNLAVDLRQIRLEVEKRIQSEPDIVTKGILPLSRRTKAVIEHAKLESQGLGNDYVGTEHLLLGLLSDSDGVGGQVLRSFGLEIEDVRKVVVKVVLGPRQQRSKTSLVEKPVPRIFEKPQIEASPLAPLESTPFRATGDFIAVDIGNSRMKIGRFTRGIETGPAAAEQPRSVVRASLPEPTMTIDLLIDNESGDFDVRHLRAWCDDNVGDQTLWVVATVHRAAAQRLAAAIADWARQSQLECPIRHLTHRDLPLAIRVDEPARVGIDRLLAALAANRLRGTGRAAIVVDLGSAITVDLLTAEGAFAGGAILPGIAMSARALAEQTDALPDVGLDRLENPPVALGKSTTAAIEAGLYWGAVGAIRELITKLSAGMKEPPEIFLTGGAAPQVAELLNADRPVRYVPHLVLAGIALVAEAGC
ncbi:MAG: type III pantothenate kinase [Pirellulales bacterium]